MRKSIIPGPDFQPLLGRFLTDFGSGPKSTFLTLKFASKTLILNQISPETRPNVAPKSSSIFKLSLSGMEICSMPVRPATTKVEL